MDTPLLEYLQTAEFTPNFGKVFKVGALVVEADGPAAALGDFCTIECDGRRVFAEVIRAERDRLTLCPFDPAPIRVGARVFASQGPPCPVGDQVLGQAFDAFGAPLEAGALPPRSDPPDARRWRTPPLARTTPRAQLVTGMRAIDGTLPLRLGQRMGVFAASGVGKTTFLASLARFTEVDRIVFCLVGERGREVEDLWRVTLDHHTRQRSVLVAATSDESAAKRLRAVDYALLLAETWRAQGLNVMLFVDSATRIAAAQRELGLAAGEPPASRGLTPSVFAIIPRFVERCGALAGSGSISALFTVLAETDDVDDPITELMKSVLDGHIILSRQLAEAGHFPAIDIARSVSRLADLGETAERVRLRRQVIKLWSRYEESKLLIETGLYKEGHDPELDEAINKRPAIKTFLQQEQAAFSSLSETLEGLSALVEDVPA